MDYGAPLQQAPIREIELLKRVRLNSTRIEQLVEQIYELNRRLVGEEGRLLRLAKTPASGGETSWIIT